MNVSKVKFKVKIRILFLVGLLLTVPSTATATKYLCVADRGYAKRGFDIFIILGEAVQIDTELRTVTLYSGWWGKPNEVIDEFHTTGSKTPHYVIKGKYGNRKYKVYKNLNYKATTWGGNVKGACEIKK